MINVDYLTPKMLIASMGKILTNGEIYTTVVYLGENDSADNWVEVDESEKPSDESNFSDTDTEDNITE